MIYLDNNATTAIDPRVAETISRVWSTGPLNPSSQHRIGQQARQLWDESLESLGQALGTTINEPGSSRLVITSGGTESNNMAIRQLRGGSGPLLVSAIEHPSVLAVAQNEQARGRDVHLVPVDSSGVIRLSHLAELLDRVAEPTTVVSIMSANNETGVIQPIERVSELCRNHGVALHVDATQSIGKQDVQLSRWLATAVTFTAHKFHGPVGVGALWLAAGETLEPVFHGGQQQLDTRPGTEPLPLVVGMSQALRLALDGLAPACEHMRTLRDRFETRLVAEFPELLIHGRDVDRLPNTSCLSLIGTDRQSMLMALDLAGVACSSGSACTSGSSPPSHVLTAMEASPQAIESAIRFSLSRETRDEDIEQSLRIISRCYKRLRRS